jgi:hypothetical protein
VKEIARVTGGFGTFHADGGKESSFHSRAAEGTA